MEGDQLGSKFPPGFRFHPSDEELIVHYLQNKISSRPLPASIIAEIDLYKYNPWELPKKALFGEDEWYFFSPRDRKYPKGLRPNRAAASGYWKATGTDKPIISSCGSKHIGVTKALVFYRGRPPNGSKTDWIMNEYRLIDTATKPSGFKGSMRLDEWVLCRVRHRGYSLKNTCENQDNPRGPNFLPNLPWSEESPSNMVTDFQYKDYKILASILVGEPVLPTDILSNLSFKGNSLNSVYEQGSNKVNSHITIPSLDSYLDTLNEDIQCGNFISSNWKLNIENKVLINNDINCNNQNQSQHGILNESPPDPTISFQVTGRYQQ